MAIMDADGYGRPERRTDSSARAVGAAPRPGRSMVPLLRWERRTATVGLIATAVAFGPARMAFGMVLPSIREAFGLSGSAAGAIASMAFAAFALALVAASLLTRLVGAKLPVVLGGALALAGAATVSLATSAPWLAVGVALAASSAGLCWTPFNAVAGRLVRARRRDRVLSIVSTGTTLGVALMALGALALAWTGASWRLVWVATALGGALVTALSLLGLPPSRRILPRRPPDVPELNPRDMARRLLKAEAWPIYALSFGFGAATAAFSTFAVDHVAGALGGAATDAAGALTVGGLVFLAYGALGLVGFLSDAIEGRLGLRRTVALCFASAAAGTATLALAPGSWTLASLGSGLVGASAMVFSVMLSVGCLRVFPALPVMGFTAAVIAMSLGSVAGPALTGAIADASGTAAALLAAAAVAALGVPLAAMLAGEQRAEGVPPAA